MDDAHFLTALRTLTFNPVRARLAASPQAREEVPILAATLHVRLGEVEKAKALIARYLQAGGRDTVHREDLVPLIEPAGTDYVEALRTAGMPEQ